jgi:hypothetical protein
VAHVVGGDDAGGVVADELELHAEPPEEVALLRLEPDACERKGVESELGFAFWMDATLAISS